MANITITAKITLDYDTEEGLVSNEREAAADLWTALSSGQFTGREFLFFVVAEDGTETLIDPES